MLRNSDLWTWCIWCNQSTNQSLEMSYLFRPLHCTDDEIEVSLQLVWERPELGSRRVRDHTGRGVEDLVLYLLNFWRVPSCGTEGTGRIWGVNSDGILTHHIVTCSEVRLLSGPQEYLLSVLKMPFGQCWMPFKMYFIPRCGSSTHFSHYMEGVWKETGMCVLQTGEYAHKPSFELPLLETCDIFTNPDAPS